MDAEARPVASEILFVAQIMSEFFCTKYKMAKGAALVPSHQTDEDELKKLPVGQPLRVKVTRLRNVGHHRKYFALLNYAFECWEPPERSPKGSDLDNSYNLDAEKNFDRFRHDIIILCGFYHSYYRINGEVRLEPKSISFSSMDQDEFEKLYDKTIDVIIKHVLRNYTGDELREVVDQIMEFDS